VDGPISSDGTVLRLTAEPQAAGRARRAAVTLARELGADPEARDSIAVAVTEAVANVVVHAYRDGPDGQVEVTLRGDGDCMEVVVSDSGVGMRPRDDSPGLGLGLGLMAALADVFEVKPSRAGGTAVRLGFRLR
jgi:anti-sigma regulatory factor (Ser/Thr protein kinase)